MARFLPYIPGTVRKPCRSHEPGNELPVYGSFGPQGLDPLPCGQDSQQVFHREPIAGMLAIALLLACLLASSVGAAPPDNEGHVYFPSISNTTSTPTRVYVDGKPARYQYQNGTDDAVMPAGRHLLQIESKVEGKLQAMRCVVDIKAGERQAVRVILRPVVLGGPAIMPDGRQDYEPAGAPGPQGMPGPPALPMRPLPEGHDIFTLREIVHAGLEILLDDLQGRVDAVRNRLPAYAGPVYVYAPKGLSIGPGEPDGPPGPPGRAGIPAEVALIQTPEGEPVLDWLLRQRPFEGQPLSEVRSRLADLERRIDALGSSPQASRRYVSTIDVLTPEFKQELDSSLKTLAILPGQGFPIGDLPGMVGPPGAMGPRGPDGKPPADVHPVRLSKEDLQQLPFLLSLMGAESDQVSRLWTSLDDLEKRVYLAENDRMVDESRSPAKKP